MAKRIFIKEKIDRQLAVYSTSIPFMNINNSTGCNQKVVSFDNHNVLDTKIDKLTAMIAKLTTKKAKPTQPKTHQGKKESSIRNHYCERGRQQNKNRSNSTYRFRR